MQPSIIAGTTAARRKLSVCLFVLTSALILAASAATCQNAPPAARLPADWAGPDAFIDVGERLGSARAVRGWGGLAAFDYDNDGDIDLLVTNGPNTANRLFENDGAAHFVEVAQQAGLARSADNCTACAVGDFNNDGWLDIMFGRQRVGLPTGAAAGPVLMLNRGPDAAGVVSFQTATPEQTGLISEAPAMAIGVGDLDSDGLLDVVIGRYDMAANGNLVVPIYESQPNELWRCTGVSGGLPTFERVDAAGIEGAQQPGFSPDTADRRFIPGTLVLYMTDVDSDGRLDFFDLHDIPGGIDYFHNNGDMTFERRQADLLNKHGGWMGMAGADYDADGDIDYFATNVGCDFGSIFVPFSVAGAHNTDNGAFFHKLLRNDDGVLTDVTAATPVTPAAVLPPTNALGGTALEAYEFGFGTCWIDADNRGVPDLYWAGDLIGYLQPGFVINAHGVGRFLRNEGDGSFTDRTAERGLFNIPPDRLTAFGEQEAGRAVVAVDLNGDGFRDLVVTNATDFGTPDAGIRLFLNPARADHHWLTVRLVGTSSNRFGIGARVTATAGDRLFVSEVLTTTSAFAGVQPEAHFGLGSATTVDRLEIAWPSGKTSILRGVAPDQILTVMEP